MTQSDTLTQTLQNAVAQHQAGNLTEAENLYKEVLKQVPNQPDALNLLGVIAADNGDTDQAIQLFDRAIAAAPALATASFNKGNALRDAERPMEAKAAYESALAQDPDFHAARLNLGVLLHKDGLLEDALTHFNSLIKHAPLGHPSLQKAHYNVGKCLHDQGKLEAAETALLAALQLTPGDADAHFAISNVYADLQKHQDAVTHIETAIQARPDWPEAYSVLGLSLSRLGQTEHAIAASERATELSKDGGQAHLNLALVYQAAGQADDAKAALKNAMARGDADEEALVTLATLTKDDLDPWGALNLLEHALDISRTATTLNNVGATLRDLDLTVLARAFYEAAHEEDPLHVEAARSLGYSHLRLGSLKEGWRINQMRLEDKHFQRHRHNSPPFWRGEDLSTKRLHVFLEEGVGDQILQASLLEDIFEKTGECAIECIGRLAPILQRTFPRAVVMDERDSVSVQDSLEKSDFQCPALELGHHLRQTFGSFPLQRASFLKPDARLVEHYRNNYIKMAEGKKIVGLAWSSKSPGYGKHKALELAALRSVLETESIFFVSLQYGDVQSEVDAIKEETGKEETGKEETGVSVHIDSTVNQLTDLNSFFAQVAALDLVITISNSTAHVAGAVGTPTWLMLPRGAGCLWYWFTDREDSPWYPSVRIFRQKSIPVLDQPWWPEVIEQVSAALQD